MRLIPLLGVSATLPFVVSCGVENLGYGVENDFNSVILYVSQVNPQPLQGDIVNWQRVSVPVWTVDPTVEILGDGEGDDDGICESNETCCGDVGPSYPNFQNTCCVATTTVDLCVGAKFVDDFVNIDFILEPKKNFQGEPISPYSSPVILQDVYITFQTLTNGCPDLPDQSLAVNFAIQPDESVHTYGLSLISQSVKSYLYSLGNSVFVSFTNTDGCVTTIGPIMDFDGICDYLASARFNAVELFSGDSEQINVQVSVRLADFQTDGDECVPNL